MNAEKYLLNQIRNEIVERIGEQLANERIPKRVDGMKRFHGSRVFDVMPNGMFITHDEKDWQDKHGYTVRQYIERTGDVIHHTQLAHFKHIKAARDYVQALLRRNSYTNEVEFQYMHERSKFDR